MAEVTNELLFEILKQVQPRLDRMDYKLDEVKAELNALRGHQISMLQDIQNVYAILGRSDARLDRIERRLDLSDTPVL